jgi:glycosyltransferase involved in cell wall biosynthesis
MLVSPSMDAGGAERVVTMLMRDLANAGHALALLAPPGPLDSELVGVPHRRAVVGDGARRSVMVLHTAWRVRAEIARFAPDVVHAHNVKAALTASLAARVGSRPRPPVLATFHGVTPAEYARSARLLSTADQVACVSGDLLDVLGRHGFPLARASVVANGVAPLPRLSAARRRSLDADLGLGAAPVVLSVGRLVTQKAHWRFIRAAAIVLRSRPDVRFLLVGQGPLQAELQRQISAAGLSDSISLTGLRPDARELIARADVLVFSSDWEGLSIAALEALAAGTPVLSTRVQGMSELLAGGAGATVDLDDGSALGYALLQLLGDEMQRHRMGVAGRAKVAADYSTGAMTSAYERLYRQLIESGRRQLSVSGRCEAPAERFRPRQGQALRTGRASWRRALRRSG